MNILDTFVDLSGYFLGILRYGNAVLISLESCVDLDISTNIGEDTRQSGHLDSDFRLPC